MVSDVGKAGTQTLNGSTAVVVNCHVPADSSSQPAVTLVNNGPVCASKAPTPTTPTSGTIIRTSSSSSTISPQPAVKSVPTVTLVRPPMQTPTSAPQSVTPPAVSVSSNAGIKTTVQTGGTAAVRSPTVLQNLRTSVPSTPPAGIRAIAPQVLAPRLAQPQQNAPNIQNIQLPPGKLSGKQTSACFLSQGCVKAAGTFCFSALV